MKQDKRMGNKEIAAYCVFGAKTVLGILENLERHVHGVFSGRDSEDVHQTRVSSRRMAAALSMFSSCFPKKKRRRWAREIKGAAQALNAARDLDVQASLIEEYLKGAFSDAEKIGPAMLLEKDRSERDMLIEEARRALDDLVSKGVLEDIRAECESIMSRNGDVSRDASYAAAGLSVMNRIDELLSYDRAVYSKRDIVEHHKMRIAAKRLRYSLEILQRLLESREKAAGADIKKLKAVVEMSEQIEEIKKLQQILGEMHDCDVLIERIPSYERSLKQRLAREKGRKKVYAKAKHGLCALRKYLRKKRGEEYLRLVSLWEEQKRRDLFSLIKKSANPMGGGHETGGRKIAVFSDIHGNLEALSAVLRDAKEQGAQVYINAGDVTGCGPWPDECIKELMEVCALSVLGNYDKKVLEAIKGILQIPQVSAAGALDRGGWQKDNGRTPNAGAHPLIGCGNTGRYNRVRAHPHPVSRGKRWNPLHKSWKRWNPLQRGSAGDVCDTAP